MAEASDVFDGPKQAREGSVGSSQAVAPAALNEPPEPPLLTWLRKVGDR
jgi:hypothetical protein